MMARMSAEEVLTKQPFAVSVRRFILFLAELCILYFFIWIPWRPNRVLFLLFFGVGMIQIAATYAQENNPHKPALFMGNIMILLVSILAVAGFIGELVIGFRAKPWWEALLLPIPPFMIASVWFRSRNPAPPFFIGILALFLALLGTLIL
jgi:hypothetical protein